MKVANIFESYAYDSYTAADAAADEMEEAIYSDMVDAFRKGHEFVYDMEMPDNMWDEGKLRPDLKTGEDIYLPKKQYSALESYASQLLDNKTPVTNSMRQRFTKFINTYGTTFHAWEDSDEGQAVRRELLDDLADREAYGRDAYAYHGVSRKDFY